MSVFAGHVKKNDPKWPYITAFILIALLVWLVISAISCVSRLVEDRVGKVEVKVSTTTTTMPTKEAEIIATTTSLPEEAAEPQEEKADSGLSVAKISFTSQITPGNLPSDSLDSVDPAEQDKIYCYTRIENQGETIHHVWINPAGKIVADIPLELHKQPADTWSFVSVSGYNPGKWEVQVKTADGQVIAKKSFTTTAD